MSKFKKPPLAAVMAALLCAVAAHDFLHHATHESPHQVAAIEIQAPRYTPVPDMAAVVPTEQPELQPMKIEQPQIAETTPAAEPAKEQPLATSTAPVNTVSLAQPPAPVITKPEPLAADVILVKPAPMANATVINPVSAPPPQPACQQQVVWHQVTQQDEQSCGCGLLGRRGGRISSWRSW
jgi:hypothetical protein